MSEGDMNERGEIDEDIINTLEGVEKSNANEGEEGNDKEVGNEDKEASENQKNQMNSQLKQENSVRSNEGIKVSSSLRSVHSGNNEGSKENVEGNRETGEKEKEVTKENKRYTYVDELNNEIQRQLQENSISVPLHPEHPLAMTYLQNKWIQTDTLRTHELYNAEFVQAHGAANFNLQSGQIGKSPLYHDKNFLEGANPLMYSFQKQNLARIQNHFNQTIHHNIPMNPHSDAYVDIQRQNFVQNFETRENVMSNNGRNYQLNKMNQGSWNQRQEFEERNVSNKIQELREDKREVTEGNKEEDEKCCNVCC